MQEEKQVFTILYFSHVIYFGLPCLIKYSRCTCQLRIIFEKDRLYLFKEAHHQYISQNIWIPKVAISIQSEHQVDGR